MRRPTHAFAFSLALLGAAGAHADERSRLVAVEIEGRLLEPKEKLERFLGLVPGVEFSQDLEKRARDDIQALGYRLLDWQDLAAPGGFRVVMKVAPGRVVRKIKVHGNWPLFDDEILRHLTLRSGSVLPPDDELAQALLEEAGRVREFLERDGFFGSTVRIVPHQGPEREWIDLEVMVHRGEWYRLGEVVVEGKHPISNEELFDIFGDHCCFFWGRFTVTQMREDARTAEKRLRDRGYPSARVVPDFDFSRDADPRTRRIRLPITINEKRKVVVRFFGNRNIPDRELTEQLTLFATGAYDEVELAESARAVQHYYQQHGYFEVKVNFKRHRQAEVEAADFFVDEGPELKVRAVDVVSETDQSLHFSPEEIRARAGVETKPFPTLGVIGLGSGGYVTTVQLQQDADRIAELYRHLGFDKVKARGEVARDPSSFSALGALGAETAGAIEKRDDLYVRFFVTEGRQRLVDDVAVVFAGPHKKTEQQIRARLKMTRGQPFTDEAFHVDQQRLVDLYGSSGQPYMEADYKDTRWNEAGDRVRIVYRIHEDGEVVFGEIAIRGNFKTRDRVILKDLPFRPGDRFDLAKIEEGARNLRTHLLFNTVEVKPVGLDDQRNPVPVLVVVQERYLDRFGRPELSVGFATDKLPYYSYLAFGWVFNNLAGFGSEFEARAETGFSADSWNASGRYTDLRAFGPGWRFDLNGFYRRDLTARFGPLETFGGWVGLTRYLTLTTRIFGRYDIYKAQIGVGFNRIAGPYDQSTVKDDTLTSKLTFGLVWDRRVGADEQPNPLAPVKGWLLSASAGWAQPPPIGDHQFFVLSAQAVGILPFRVRSTGFALVANLRFDEGFPIGESALPIVERFFAGGDTTTRGYDTDQLRTEIIPSRVAPLQGGVGFRVIPQGGNVRILSTIEFQFPIANKFLGFLPFPWAGAVFYDAGTIVDALNLLGWSDIKHSVGISLLRILTPVGPLSFEYAYPLTQSLAEERWKTSPWYSHYPGRIHFNWGIPLSR